MIDCLKLTKLIFILDFLEKDHVYFCILLLNVNVFALLSQRMNSYDFCEGIAIKLTFDTKWFVNYHDEILILQL